MKEIKLTLSVQEVNMAIQALGQLPYNQVHEMMAKIYNQANEQLVSLNGKDKKESIEGTVTAN